MSSSDIRGLREQILANANLMLNYAGTAEASRYVTTSSSTLVPEQRETIDVVVFGEGSSFVAAVMAGINPAIEGGEATTPEAALRKLLLAVAETMSLYIPKIGVHQRNIHGGGIFDEDLIAKEFKNGSGTSR